VPLAEVTPRQESTEATTKQLNHAMTMRQALADMARNAEGPGKPGPDLRKYWWAILGSNQ